ncbi:MULTISPECIES: M1 family metallopeptidase [unclassified Streptomyces]|uniref:M1 family metallopeptidase n=1 Tax=unclassified Streptomyces TaxID=2593676 RepID=UPI00081D64BC|nr:MULTISPECIES: M1 family metallopeptidase [unclassified Streptomyces]MYR25072.1 M1 family peptidase [Streptomyces sp. SID4945]SCE73348.1 Peptidase family M1 [Streptomyces sp. LcepLS]
MNLERNSANTLARPGPGAGAEHMGRPAPPRPRRRARRTARVLVPVLAVCLALIAAAAPSPGPQGIGDRLFPALGNPGYDVLAYDLSLTYKGDNRAPLEAVTRVTARAEAPLDRLNLDFSHGEVHSVTVNGRAARHASAGQDLVVTPEARVRPGERLRIVVRHTSDPRPPGAGQGEGGWVRTKDGLAMANQADAAHRVFPGNDHPSDKADFTFRVTAPRGVTVVANGLLAGRADAAGGATTWTYRTLHPMATELAQLSLGRSAVPRRPGPHGLPVRDVVPAADRERLEPWLRRTPGQLRWMEKRVGTFPFEAYGVLVADTNTGFELETQTLSLFERRLFTDSRYPEWYVDSVLVHELAHQWFGDSVSPRTWSDLWLNEGHATWYETLYAEERGGPTLERRMREAYGASDGWRAEGGPPARPKAPGNGKISIFRPVVYDGSALVLYALRQEVGADAFSRIERRWVAEHRDGTADTAAFVRLASDVAGRDLGAFLHPWLYGAKTPPMPGHPDWTADAPGTEQPRSTSPHRLAEPPRMR